MSDWTNGPGRVPPVVVKLRSVGQKALQIGGATTVGLVAVAIDQILRGEAVLSEWWVDLPLAALVAALFVRATKRRHQPPGPRPLDAVGEVMLAVSRGHHVDDVLESLTRQACRIIGWSAPSWSCATTPTRAWRR